MNMDMTMCGAEEGKGGKVEPGERRGLLSRRNKVPPTG